MKFIVKNIPFSSEDFSKECFPQSWDAHPFLQCKPSCTLSSFRLFTSLGFARRKINGGEHEALNNLGENQKQFLAGLFAGL
jgi:hypothetical protein